MYTTFFGLREKPFDLLPNPDFLFPSRAHNRALTYLLHGIRERAGFILLTGEVGSGKTTIIRNIIRTQMQNRVLSKVFNTKVDSQQLLAQINEDFGLDSHGKDKTTLLRELNDFLIEQYAKGKQAVLIIDEAQNLSSDLLEEVRMLSNLETDRDKLLQIILVGQPELKDTLAMPGLLQLRQRIQISCHIQPLNVQEVEEYILYRLEKAGNKSALEFTPEAITAVATYSRGIPRLINIICDYIMIDAYSSQNRQIDGTVVHELAADLSFNAQYWNVKTPSAALAPDNGDAPRGDIDGVAKAMAYSAKIHGVLRSMNKRIESLESMPALDQASVLDLRERVAGMEQTLDARIKELWLAQQHLRSEFIVQQNPQDYVVKQEEKKPVGTMRLIWNFLWGS